VSRDGKKGEKGEIVEFRPEAVSDTRRHERREAKARDLKQRFASARQGSESKAKSAERLKKLFKNPGRNLR